ncbi:MAG TPA: alkaline phytoceramidase [Burkholderiales bacterium]|nr:alkaline phytoceramidase [Burkholderiales bacterium]
MDLWRSVDLYCERTDPGYWSEPVNALSNVAFLVAAALIVRHCRVRGPVPSDAVLLAALVALVGVGSFLFHTFATVWAGWLDGIFILAFIYVFLARFLARVPGWGWKGIAAALAGYWLFARGVTMSFPAGALNGSLPYFPALFALVGLAVWSGSRKGPGTDRLAIGAGLFAVSLVFRTVDLTLCDAWPIGTHGVWHCLNAAVLWLVATGLVADQRSAS